MRSEIRSRSTSANSAKSVVMTLVWMSGLPSTRMFSRTSNRGLFALPGVGVGIRDWSPDRTWFVAPEVQFLMTSVLTLNVSFNSWPTTPD